MRPRELIDLQREQPFTGLRVQLSDGSSYDVPHPERMVVTHRRVYIALSPIRDGAPARGVSCDPLHITHVEPLNGRKPKAARKRRR
jgi:hypothetical protein